MNDSFITDSFALAAGGSGFTRVRVESQTERLTLFWENYFDLLRFEPAPVFTSAFDGLATSIPIRATISTIPKLIFVACFLIFYFYYYVLLVNDLNSYKVLYFYTNAEE